MEYIMKQHTKKQHRRGVSLIEYGILAALIAITCIATIKTLAANTSSMYCEISDSLGIQVGLGTANCATGGIASKLYGVGYTGSLNVTGGISCGNICTNSNINSIDAEIIGKLNAIDPITSFYGLVNSSTGKTADSVDEAYQLVNLGGNGKGGITDPNGDKYHYEVQTTSGKTYGIFTSNNSMGYRDLSTGETYYLNSNTGNIVNKGITTGDLDYKNLFFN